MLPCCKLILLLLPNRDHRENTPAELSRRPDTPSPRCRGSNAIRSIPSGAFRPLRGGCSAAR